MEVKERLQKMVEGDRLPHLLLFSGPKEKTTEAAYFLIERVLGESKSHPDCHELFPEGKTAMHSISSLKMMLLQAALFPVKGSRQFFLLHDAERLLSTSSHALLKSLEEPHPRTNFILLTTKSKYILPTISSRAQKVVFPTSLSPSKSETMLTWLKKGVKLEEIASFAKDFEEKRKEREKKLLTSLPKESTSHDKEFLMREVYGALSLEAKELFATHLETILFWYRDLKIFADCIDTALIFPELREELEARKGEALPLHEVEGALRFAQMAYDRASSLETCLETLFLRLKKVVD